MILVIKKLEASSGIQAQNSCRCWQRRAAEESSDSGGVAIRGRAHGEACRYCRFLVQRSVEKILEDGVRVLVLVVVAPEPWLMVLLWMLAAAVELVDGREVDVFPNFFHGD
ncbi:unnamed protein product [Microthlaspi erraticum]|uniref:Uncharacterized protein n=1 Tax=Microthlaspi erraticum TaxID=1685480 RepID=A0A6D2JED1_9BRAS|nr:unnamed protein product [Microthlaspi erraticum]